MAVFATLAISPAMAADTVIDSDKTYSNGLTMSGDSNKIVSEGASVEYKKYVVFGDWQTYTTLAGYIAGKTDPNVTVTSGNITMSTTNGYNAIVGSATGALNLNVGVGRIQANGGRPTVTAQNGDVIMNGPANALMLGSTVTGNNITLQNTGEQTITVGKFASGVLGDMADSFVNGQMGQIEGIFNIVQGSTLTATGSVTLNTATNSSVNELKVNVIAGGRGDISDVVSQVLSEKLGSTLSGLAGSIINAMTNDDDIGSTITAGADITLGGGASVIVDTTLSDLVDFAETEDVAALLAGNENNKTTVTLSAGKDLNLNSLVNMAYAAQGGVNLSAGNAINATGAFNIIGGKTTLKADAINLTPTTSASVNELLGLVSGLGNLLPDMSGLTEAMGNLADQKISANVVAGGATLEATGDITTGGTLGLLMNTPVAEAANAFLGTDKNPSEFEIICDLLQEGTATSITSTNGNINVGSQFNLLHGGNMADKGAALTVTAGKAVNIEGTANVVSGNVVVNAGEINLTGEVLPADLKGTAAAVVDKFAGSLGAVSGVVDKLVDKGSVNMVTGGATLNSTGDINMTATPVDGKGKIGNINAVIDTEIVDVLEAKDGDFSSLVQGGGHTTTLNAAGSINMLGRVNVVNGKYVQMTAGEAVNLQGNLSMIGGATVNADSININTSDDVKYKMYMGDELRALLPNITSLPNALANVPVNAAVVAGGAVLTADKDITTGGTLGLVLNTPMAEAGDSLMSLVSGSGNMDMDTLADTAKAMLQAGTATSLTSTNGNINVGSQFNLLHGGNMADKGAALTVTAANGAVNVQGTANVVSGNVVVDAKNINLTGEQLPADLQNAAQSLMGSFGGSIPNLIPGGAMLAETGILNDLVTKGSVNMVTGGATLNSTGDINMTGKSPDDVGKIGNINAVIDTEIVDVLEAMNGDTSSLVQGGAHMTTLNAEGSINMLGRVNVVNGSYVTLDAGKDVNLQGNISMVSGEAKVNADGYININTSDEEKYKMYIGSDELGAVVPADSPYMQLLTQMGVTDKLDHTGINGAVVAGGATLTAGQDITTGGTASILVNTPMDGVMDELVDLSKHNQEIWAAYQLLQKGTATKLEAGNNIELGSRLNVLHGGNMADASQALALKAGNTVKLDGTINVVSGNVTVDAENIELKGGQNVSLDLAPLVGAVMGGSEYADLINGSGMLDKIATKGVNANVVTGGATLTANNSITLDGMANFVLDTEMTDVVETVMERNLDALAEGGSYKTTLTANNGDINLLGRLNVVNGGQVALAATNGTVNIEGTANIISGNATVTGKNVEINGKNSVGLDWGALLPDKYASYGELAEQMGILDKLNSGVNGNVIAGGAEVTAVGGDITIDGMATAVVDVTLGNVLEAVQTMNGTPIMEGGAEDTTLTATGNINLNSRLNLVNGGQVTVAAGQNVNMNGTFNTVSGNATVKAGGNIEMTAKNKVGVDISPMLDGHYAEIAKELGMADVLENGVSSNIVAGGANLQAEGNVVMSGVATAIVDTTASNVIGAVKGENLGELMKGGRSTTEVTAKGDIKLESQMNVVNGGNSKNAGGVVLNAGNDVLVGGQISVVNRATVKAGNGVNFSSEKSVVKYSDITADTVSFTGKDAEVTDVNFGDSSVAVNGTHLVNTADSEIAINELLAEVGNIENLGTLNLNDAALAGTTLYNAGSITVNGALTLNSATLSFVADSNNVTVSSTAIVLGEGGSIFTGSTFSANSSADMIAGVNFMLNYDVLEFEPGSNEFEFNLAIFEGATTDEFDALKAAISSDELSITLDNNYIVTVQDMEVEYNNGVVSLTGIASVPEPTTATLSLLALAALAARRRRR